jgi:hypothetical protein
VIETIKGSVATLENDAVKSGRKQPEQMAGVNRRPGAPR